jgi:DNA-binding NtrC family response regulator
MDLKDQFIKEGDTRTQRELEYPIIGKSRAVDQLVKNIQRLGKSRADVIIIGEAGVGKGAVAKNIAFFGRDPEAKRKFSAINLSVADDKELESQIARLFSNPTPGGTVLFEEIEEASFRNQMKMLNFMNARQSGAVNLDLRVIVTLKDAPHALLEKRRILEDLFVKVEQFERVAIPPLRERPEDIPLMVKYFSTELCNELNISDLTIDINALDVLVRQNWRENIRELKAVIDKSVIFSTGGRFSLPPELVDEKTEIVKMIENIESGQDFVLDLSLDLIEKGIIERALQKFGFNQSKAAGFLGMTEQTLRYKLKRLGIASSRAR